MTALIIPLFVAFGVLFFCYMKYGLRRAVGLAILSFLMVLIFEAIWSLPVVYYLVRH